MLRHRHLSFVQSTTGGNTPESQYARKQAALWLCQIFEMNVAFDEAFFDCMGWCIGGLNPLVRKVCAALEKQSGSQTFNKTVRGAKNLLKSSASNLAHELSEFGEDYPASRNVLADMVMQSCKEASSLPSSNHKLFIQARKKLYQTFSLSDAAIMFCEYVFINQSFSQVENYFENHLEVHTYANRRILAKMLGMPYSELLSCITELESCGLLEEEHYFRLPDSIILFWNSNNSVSVNKMFCQPVTGKTMPLIEFSISSADVAHVLSISKLPGDAPVHILLYGPPGTGKTTFARSLAKHLNVKAWAVSSRDDDEDRQRRSSLAACLAMAKKHPGAFILVDEAERLLATDMHFGRQTKDKAWLNNLLEQAGLRIIWITNDVDHIDQAVRRRFTYSIYFEKLNNQERKKVWLQIMGQERVAKRLTVEQLDNLVQTYDVPAAVIEQSVVQAKKIYRKHLEFYDGIELILKAYTRLRSGGGKLPLPVKAAQGYTLDGVCLEGSAAVLLEKCIRVDAALRSSGNIRPGCGTMLFYGPPGTGKTALARYLAEQMHRPCLVKRASDLLSMYVGQAEKQIAEAFAEAANLEAVLVIDEADTFLYPREIAQRSWETSLVNEFLTALEECRGFCICTTNRREQMDTAAMRRFSHKVAFTYAGQAQVLALYNKLLAPLCTDTLPKNLQQELENMSMLTPGDFHAVLGQYDSLFVEQDFLTHQTLIAALAKEQDLKAPLRRIGFNR